MRISRIRVYQVDLPLKKPYYLSGGKLRFDGLDSTMVSVETDAGVTGWGEGCPWGVTYLPAFGHGIRAGLDELAPQLLGLDPRAPAQVNRIMDLALPGHPYIKAPVDIACWDILGQVAGLPLCELLGGRCGGPVPIASSVSTGTPEEMLATVDDFRKQGYRLHSAKIGGPDRDLDVARIRHLNSSQQSGETIFFDLNRSWRPADAVAVMNQLRDLGVFFEQPCETYEENLQVRRLTGHPISLDEGIKEMADLVRTHADGAAEIVNIKVSRVGGLTKARLMRDFCLACGIKLLIMDTGGGALSDTMTAHLAQSTPPDDRIGTWDCASMVSVVAAEGASAVDGHISAPDTPGLGARPVMEVLGDPVAIYQ
jgi:L-alanine-DL-glutamate epimerase-like enolase superfamily enzyme